MAPTTQSGRPEALHHARSGRSALRFAADLIRRLNKDRWLGLAAEMAFWLFLSMLPLAAVAGLLVAKLTIANDSLTTSFAASLPPTARELVMTEFAKVAAWNGGSVGAAASLTFLWLASSGVDAIFEGAEQVSGAKPRSWIRKRLLAMATCVGLSIGVAALALLATGLGWVFDLMGVIPPKSGPFGDTLSKVLRTTIGAGVWLALLSALYAVAVPAETRRKMPIVPGAALAVSLQTLISYGYGFYVRTIGDGGAYQAGLAAIAVTLITLYLLSLTILLGIEVNQMLGERRQPGQTAQYRNRQTTSTAVLP